MDGKNIASTHALFSTADDELLELIEIGMASDRVDC